MRRLLDALLPRLEELESLRADGCDMNLWWTGDSDSEQGAFNMSPELLRDLARLGLDLRGTVNLSDET